MKLLAAIAVTSLCMVASAMPLGLRMAILDGGEVEAVEPKKWTVAFDANGGLIYDCDTISYIEVEDGTEIGGFPGIDRPGYYFIGWFTEKDGGNQIGENLVISEDATYYAHWVLPHNGIIHERVEDCEFEYIGSAQSPLLDGDILHLPFDFPWGGITYREIDLGTFGCINFANGNDGYIWVADGMDSTGRCIFIKQSEHSLTVRWGDDGTATAEGVANASITLYDDGSFALNYGANDSALGQGFDFYHDNIDWYPTSIYCALTSNKRVLIEVEWTESDPIPDIGEEATGMLVRSALEGFVDSERLTRHITNGYEYTAFRNWMENFCGFDFTKRQRVKDSIHAWLSFALDADTLIVNAPKLGDLKIEEFKPNATSGAFDFEVSVENIFIGEGATAANLAEIFGIEGSTTPNGDYSSNDVELSFGTPENGRVKCAAKPKDATNPSFFMKVRMNP